MVMNQLEQIVTRTPREPATAKSSQASKSELLRIFYRNVSFRLETFSEELATILSLYALDNCGYTSDSLGARFGVGLYHSWIYSRPVGRGDHYHCLAPG